MYVYSELRGRSRNFGKGGGGVGKFESIKRMYILLSGAGPEILKGGIR